MHEGFPARRVQSLPDAVNRFLGFSLRGSDVVVGHRGWPTQYPDNCLAGFLAVSVIADTVELDIRRSSDGKLVLAHDPTLGDHVVSETPWATLVEVDLGGGHHPALLDEVMAALPDTPMQLEVKNIPHQPGFEPDHRVGLEAAERARPGDIVTSFNPATLESVRRVFPDVPTGLAVEPFVGLDEAMKQCLESGHAALVPRETMIVAPLQPRDELAVFPWTVNNADRAIELVEFGVSGIITDDAATIRRALEERQ